MLCSFPSGPVLWWSFPPKKAFHWVTATSNFTTACVQGRQASESGVWCHLLDIWHFLSKPVWPFPLSWLPVGFLMGFVCPSSLRVFLLNGAPESTPIGMQLYSLFWWGSRSGGTTDAVPLDYSCPSFRHNTAMLHVVQLFSPPFEIHLQLWTLPFPQCWLLKPLKTKIYFLFIPSFPDLNSIKGPSVLLLRRFLRYQCSVFSPPSLTSTESVRSQLCQQLRQPTQTFIVQVCIWFSIYVVVDMIKAFK